MKKTYMIPTLQVVKIQTTNLLQAMSMTTRGNFGEGVTIGARGAGFSDDDDWGE